MKEAWKGSTSADTCALYLYFLVSNVVCSRSKLSRHVLFSSENFWQSFSCSSAVFLFCWHPFLTALWCTVPGLLAAQHPWTVLEPRQWQHFEWLCGVESECAVTWGWSPKAVQKVKLCCQVNLAWNKCNQGQLPRCAYRLRGATVIAFLKAPVGAWLLEHYPFLTCHPHFVKVYTLWSDVIVCEALVRNATGFHTFVMGVELLKGFDSPLIMTGLWLLGGSWLLCHSDKTHHSQVWLNQTVINVG